MSISAVSVHRTICISRIKKKQIEKRELEKQISQEKTKYSVLTVREVKFFMEQFKKGDVNDLNYRKALVDTFVRKIILYDNKMTILYNTQDGQSSLPLDLKCLSKGMLVEQMNPNKNRFYFPGGFGVTIFI